MMPSHDDSPASFLRHLAAEKPTPLLTARSLAVRCGVSQVFVKNESVRPLGSFKSLGGMYAGLRALARVAGLPNTAALLSSRPMPSNLPKLICASDGNHGLAVAAAAKLVGASAKVFLHHHVCEIRAQRIADQGAEIVWIRGTYDDSVDAALAAANRGEGILIADTSADANDRVVADVMRGYEWMANEIVSQLAEWGQPVPTHLFVQAGVGGLAAALTVGLNRSNARCQTIVVEPESVACVGVALRLGQITRLPGDLQTAAEMLSCGEASLPALNILQQHGAAALAVSEESLTAAETMFASELDLRTTPSGATGLAGFLLASSNPAIANELQLNAESRVLLIATEAATKQTSRRA